MIKEEFEMMVLDIYKIFNVSEENISEDSIEMWGDTSIVASLPDTYEFKKFTLEWMIKEYRSLPSNILNAVQRSYDAFVAGEIPKIDKTVKPLGCSECCDGTVFYIKNHDGKKYEYATPCPNCNKNANHTIFKKKPKDVKGGDYVLKNGFDT